MAAAAVAVSTSSCSAARAATRRRSTNLFSPPVMASKAGRIVAAEVVAALRSLGQNVGQAEAPRFLEEAGVPAGTGAGAAFVDLAAFLAVAARKVGGRQSAERLAECFDVFDDARTGSIPAKQLRHVMVSHGDRLPEEEADAMLREADPRGEGRVEYKEYVKVLLRDKK
ncbi:unnamed protein product [Urochloa humidicola]